MLWNVDRIFDKIGVHENILVPIIHMARPWVHILSSLVSLRKAHVCYFLTLILCWKWKCIIIYNCKCKKRYNFHFWAAWWMNEFLCYFIKCSMKCALSYQSIILQQMVVLVQGGKHGIKRTAHMMGVFCVTGLKKQTRDFVSLRLNVSPTPQL